MSSAQSYRYIEPVKLLGTSWYRRGVGYWVRRAALALVYLLVAAGSGAMSGLIVWAIWIQPGLPLAGKVVIAVVIAGVAVGTGVVTVRSYRRAEAGSEKKRTNRQKYRIVAVSTGLIGFAQMTVAGLLALACCFFIAFGGMAVTFAYSLKHEFFGEHQARLRDQKRHARHAPQSKRARKDHGQQMKG
jgi:hypothetical protein